MIAYDRRTGTAQDLSHRYPEHYTSTIITKDLLVDAGDEQHICMINLIVGGWNNYVRDTPRLTGLIAQKLVQSRLIGMQPLVVPWYEWTRLTKQEQTIYMRQKLDEMLVSQ